MKYIVYHGTGVNFRKFNLKKTTQGLFWFTDNKESILAKEVGAQTNGFIYKCEIEINKPCGWAEYDKLVQGQIAKLYDGIILPDGEFNTYVVWDPSKIKILEKQKLTEAQDAAYLSWKRKNVTIRGMKDRYAENGSGARFGSGLYTAFLSNKAMARQYGEVYFVLNAIPKHPKVFNDTNQAEIFLQKVKYDWCKKHNKGYDAYDPREFDKNTTVQDEMLALGFDGLVIKGREMVNYAPDENKIKYFQNERQLEMYYEDFIKDEITETMLNEKKTTKTITITAVDVEDTLEELLNAIKEIGNSGHGFEIEVDREYDAEYEEGAPKFYWDGDGGDKIRDIKVEEVITEDITLDIDKGDTILTGRFKNHKVEVKDIGEDEHGMPTVNGKQITKVRIPKIEESFIEKILREAYSYKKVKSSNLEIVGYDPKAKTMQVKFHSGNIYEFSAVSRFVYDALLQSESKGQFFNKFIKGRFECQKLEPTNI